VQAVILAAGEGNRLRPLTRSRPKAIIPVANRPIIEYVIDALLANGIRDIVVVVGYRKEHVIRYLNQLDAPIQVVVQDRQLGTAHALKCAEHEISGNFLLLPGDNYISPESIARIKGERNAMLVKEHPNPSEFGVVVIKDGFVQSLIEKPEAAPAFTVSTGIYAFTPDVFRYITSNEIPDVVENMLAHGEKIRAVTADDWQDAIYSWDLLKMNTRMLKNVTPQIGGMLAGDMTLRGVVRIGTGTTIGPNTTITGPAIIGNDCTIGPNAVILPNTSIGSRVQIEPFTLTGGSLIMDDVSIGSHSRIVDAVIGQGCVLGNHTTTVPKETLFDLGKKIMRAEFGAVLGEGVRAAPFTTFKNCVAGNNVLIEEGRVLPGLIEDGTRVM